MYSIGYREAVLKHYEKITLMQTHVTPSALRKAHYTPGLNVKTKQAHLNIITTIRTMDEAIEFIFKLVQL